MQNFNQISRIIKIIELLSFGAKLTCKDLERKFLYQVSKREIQRDFNHLFDSGLNIDYFMDGREKVWYLNKTYQEKLSAMYEK